MTAHNRTTPDRTTPDRTAPDGEGAHPAAAELCRRAAELARDAGGPLRRLSISSGDTVVELEWAAPAAAEAPAAAPAPGTAAGRAAQAATAPEEDGLWHVTAPMVGTFYHAGEPGAPPFVSPGDLVEKGQQIGILEAMKLMNPIEADVRGRVVEVLVPNGEPVDYGRPLVSVVPEQSR